MDTIRISAKNLGQLALPDFCPRCFWIKLRCAGKLPFQSFPGIFASIDSFSKKVTHLHYERHGSIPQWFSELGDVRPLKVPHHSAFQFVDSKTDVLLTGVPDEIVRRSDEKLLILDYKTARFSETQDSLIPLYRIQLNSYAVITQRIGMGIVSGLALIYYEAHGIDAKDIDDVMMTHGFTMPFSAKVLPVGLETESIPPLLQRVREIHDLVVPPPGRQECKDCMAIGRLVRLGSA